MNGIIESSIVEFVEELTISPVNSSKGFSSTAYIINLLSNTN
jgi:hypothetical protein